MLESIQPGIPPGAVARPGHSGQAKTSAAEVRDAARQFESLLLSELLKSVREASGSGWLGTGEDAAGDSAMGLAQEQFAQALAQSGGLGLSKLIAGGLEQTNPK
jgi:Rod binding domain-containing protein